MEKLISIKKYHLKNTLTIVILCTFYSIASAQNSAELFYIFNKDWSPAKDLKSATYFMQTKIENDTIYTCMYYQKNGPMVKWETFKDKNLQTPNGIFAWYNSRGDLDSSGMYLNGQKDQLWKLGFNYNGEPKITELYENGIFIKKTNYETKKVTLANGAEEQLLESMPKVSSSLKDIPAKYPNGDIPGWLNYISANLKTPDRFVLISGPRSSGKVGVEFKIDTLGKVESIFIFKSREWSVDSEAVRIIKAGGNWIPAEEDGIKTSYRHRQKITFQVGD